MEENTNIEQNLTEEQQLNEEQLQEVTGGIFEWLRNRFGFGTQPSIHKDNWYGGSSLTEGLPRKNMGGPR